MVVIVIAVVIVLMLVVGGRDLIIEAVVVIVLVGLSLPLSLSCVGGGLVILMNLIMALVVPTVAALGDRQPDLYCGININPVESWSWVGVRSWGRWLV